MRRTAFLQFEADYDSDKETGATVLAWFKTLVEAAFRKDGRGEREGDLRIGQVRCVGDRPFNADEDPEFSKSAWRHTVEAAETDLGYWAWVFHQQHQAAERGSLEGGLNCGDCLMDRVKVVKLVNGKCPDCGADYSNG
jgi:hypothetical protein